MTAFAAAVGALFADPNIGRDAVYIADGGAPVLVRVVARRADAITDFGDARLWSETTRIDLRVAQARIARQRQHLRASRLGHRQMQRRPVRPDGLKVVGDGIVHVAGDAKSLIVHPATTTHQRFTPEVRAAMGVSDGLIRLSIGLEHHDDLIADLEQALAKLS